MSRTQTSSAGPTTTGGNYTVLARRYRSRDFDEIVGQEPIARTLKNAVASGRTAHAYLFSGTRGVGKTSMARILARALNATGDLAQRDEVAAAILRGDDLDVIEIDGASNRRVEEARDLIAAAGVSPARSPFKVYIIDEVHMLTREAFNTLLKTMEEPPPHVKFILCTTEPNKVPATIQSRCQRFDFRSLSAAEIGGHLTRILADESIEADEQVIGQVARLGRGSMRDALSLLDRLLATGEPRLSVDLMEQMLGLPDHALIEAVVDAVAGNDAAACLRAGAALLGAGSSVEEALDLLAEHLRNCLVVSVCGADSDLLELSPSARETVARQAARFDAAGLVHLIALADAVGRSARHAATSRALFDACLVRMCQAEHLADLAGLLAGVPPAGSPPGPPAKKKEVTSSPAAPAATPVPEPKPAARSATPADDGPSLWARVQSGTVRAPSDHARVEHLIYESFDGTTLRLRADAPDPNLARWLAGQNAELEQLVQKVTGRSVSIRLVLPETPTTPVPAAASGLRDAERLAAVQTAMKIFDATVVDVQEAGAPPPAARSDDV